MKINYSDLKLSFLQYLAAKAGVEIDLSKLDETSIFSHGDELQDFLKDEFGFEDSIFSFNLNDILSMSFVDGQFVTGEIPETTDGEAAGEETAALGSVLGASAEDGETAEGIEGTEETDGTETVEETEETNNENEENPEGEQSEEENNFLLEYLNDFMSDENVKKTIDSDGNGELSDEEVDNFFKKIATSDENADDVSLTDIKNAFEQIQNGTFEEGLGGVDIDETPTTDPENPESPETPETPETPDTPETPEDTTVQDTTPTEPSSPSSPSNPGGGNTHYDSGNDTDKPDKISYSNMSLEDLKAKHTEKSAELGKYQDAISDIYSGKNSAVAAAQKDSDEKRTAYETAIQEDKQISAELKEQVLTNNKNIADKESEIATTQQAINDKDSAIYSKENEISDLDSTLNALNASKSKLESQKSDSKTKDEDKALIEQKLKEVNAKIDEVTKDKETKKGELKTLNDEKTELNTTLGTQQGDLKTLQDTKSELDTKVMETGSQATKDALTAFNTAKTNIETVKSKELATAEANLKTSKTDFDELNTAIREKEAKLTQKDYKVGQADLFTDSPYDIQKITRNGMDYILIGPKDADPNEELPVMVYLHGSGEKGNNLDKIMGASLPNMIKNHPEEIGQTFNGYILMPQTPDYWDRANRAQDVRDIVNEFGQTHAIDRDNITIAGHSMGGIGALYMAGTNDDHFFSRALVLSGYNPGKKVLENINIPVIGFGEKGNDTASLVKYAPEYAYYPSSAGHGAVPRDAFSQKDKDDNVSLIFKFLYPDYAD